MNTALPNIFILQNAIPADQLITKLTFEIGLPALLSPGHLLQMREQAHMLLSFAIEEYQHREQHAHHHPENGAHHHGECTHLRSHVLLPLLGVAAVHSCLSVVRHYCASLLLLIYL